AAEKNPGTLRLARTRRQGNLHQAAVAGEAADDLHSAAAEREPPFRLIEADIHLIKRPRRQPRRAPAQRDQLLVPLQHTSASFLLRLRPIEDGPAKRLGVLRIRNVFGTPPECLKLRTTALAYGSRQHRIRMVGE